MDKLLQLHISLLFASLLYFPSNFFSEITRPDDHALSKRHAMAVVIPDPRNCSTSVVDCSIGFSENLSIGKMGNPPINLDLVSFTAKCLTVGEQVSFMANLTSATTIPGDNFILTIIQDENGNGQVEPTEPSLFQQTYFGSIFPGIPLPLSGSFNAQATELCNLIMTLETVITNLSDSIEIALPAPVLFNAGDDQYFCHTGGTTLTTSLGIPGCGNVDYNYTWSALPPANVDDLSDLKLAQPNLTLDWANFLGDTLTFILETQRNGCTQTSFDTVQVFVPNNDSGFFQNDTLQLQAANCQSFVTFCLGISLNDAPDFEVILNSIVYPTANFSECNGDQAAVQIPVGTNVLIMTDQISGCSDTLVVDVICAVTETIDLFVLLHESDTLCFNGNELSGPIVSVNNLCPDGTFVNYEILDDSCIVFVGGLVGNESACIIACDANGFCDTTFVNITVEHPFPNGLKDTIIVSQFSDYCFDENNINIVGAIDSFENICPSASGTYANINLDPINNCIAYEGIDIGTDTACIRICDDLGHCDTINYYVTVVPGFTVFDTVFIFVDTNTYCIDDMLLPGDIVSVVDICPENNSEQVFFEINGSCIRYFGDGIGDDFACLRIEDEFGNVALINIEVTVVKTTPTIFCDSVFIGQEKEFCLDTFELPGIYQSYQILYNDDNPANVSFDLNQSSLCVLYEGLQLGNDSFSIALCDHYGFCDTTSFCITVVPYFDLPGLKADFDTTFIETSVVIDPLANDTIFGGLRDFFILDPPISGSAVLNLDGSITYTPGPTFCNRGDMFTYVACNPNGCDTTTINVFIECVQLTIFNAVSPNNDNVNDYFYIAKIENFPNNRLWVYNRWGSLVFETVRYQNNWPGSWGADIDLPDGTYYYILEWLDNDATQVQKGYFEMFR